MKHHNPTISVFLAVSVLFSTALSCNFDQTEEETNLFYSYYSIEPESLLDELDAGNIDVFTLVTEEPSPIPPDQQTLVSWDQEDYLRIANALYEFVKDESLDSWQLNSMSFALGCIEYELGFQHGTFRFFKIVERDGRESRGELIININPKGKYVFITENEYDPMLVKWGSIDLGKNQFSANETLRIAENVGGQAKRLSVQNNCDISILLSPDSASYKGWFVHYYPGDAGRATLFQINVDPITGEIR